MQPRTIIENVTFPTCNHTVKSMLGDDSAKEISLVPLSHDTTSRRIDYMTSDIQSHVYEKLIDNRVFSLQLDKSTNISNKYQLLTYIRFVDQDSITEQFFSCTELPSTSFTQMYEVHIQHLETKWVDLEKKRSFCLHRQRTCIIWRIQRICFKIETRFPESSINTLLHTS